eukprot:GHVR01165760.1.p1 GENE.GHVR01165760.1~~GHVR01165760.1.p1  ORF type:complete len:609 (+),score=208.56 GHVR01165760.1:110-1936(+)
MLEREILHVKTHTHTHTQNTDARHTVFNTFRDVSVGKSPLLLATLRHDAGGKVHLGTDALSELLDSPEESNVCVLCVCGAHHVSRVNALARFCGHDGPLLEAPAEGIWMFPPREVFGLTVAILSCDNTSDSKGKMFRLAHSVSAVVVCSCQSSGGTPSLSEIAAVCDEIGNNTHTQDSSSCIPCGWIVTTSDTREDPQKLLKRTIAQTLPHKQSERLHASLSNLTISLLPPSHSDTLFHSIDDLEPQVRESYELLATKIISYLKDTHIKNLKISGGMIVKTLKQVSLDDNVCGLSVRDKITRTHTHTLTQDLASSYRDAAAEFLDERGALDTHTLEKFLHDSATRSVGALSQLMQGDSNTQRTAVEALRAQLKVADRSLLMENDSKAVHSCRTAASDVLNSKESQLNRMNSISDIKNCIDKATITYLEAAVGPSEVQTSVWLVEATTVLQKHNKKNLKSKSCGDEACLSELKDKLQDKEDEVEGIMGQRDQIKLELDNAKMAESKLAERVKTLEKSLKESSEMSSKNKDKVDANRKSHEETVSKLKERVAKEEEKRELVEGEVVDLQIKLKETEETLAIEQDKYNDMVTDMNSKRCCGCVCPCKCVLM